MSTISDALCADAERRLQSEELETPNWDSGGRVHNWRRWVPEVIREAWHTFNTEQKRSLRAGFIELASTEEWD